MFKLIRIVTFVLLVLSLLIIGACSSIEEPKLVSVDKVELVSDNQEELIISSNLSIYNPNWFTL